jgi:tetratricopeptide (TPR) repeat protein
MAAGMRLNDRIAEGLATLDEAEPLATAAALPLALSRLHHLRGNLLFPLGRDADCVREHGLARQHARAARSLQAEAAALGGLGDGYYLQGRMRSANQQFRECVALAREHGFGRLEVANLSMIGWSGLHLAEFAASVAVGHEAIELALRASQPRAEVMARQLVAWVEGLVRARLDDAEEQAAAALHLARALGAKRFEAQNHAMVAMFALRRGDRERARQFAQKALAICREHGMGHIGPYVHGVCALTETDRDARLRWLEAGERQLALGCVSHNHVQLPEVAIDALLEIGDCDGVERQCALIRAYTANEPLPMSEFVVARGLALARFARGERGADLLDELRRLRSSAAQMEANTFLASLDAAIAAFDTAAVPGR